MPTGGFRHGRTARTMKKFLAIILPCLALLSSQTAWAKFSDVGSDFEQYKSINWLEEQGAVEGYSDGTFRPDQFVNRAEFLKMLYETIGMEGKNPSLSFPDVPNDAWYTKYVKEAFATGVASGYPDGYFKPENEINVAEALKIIDEAFFDVDQLYGNGSNFTYCPTGFLDFNHLLSSDYLAKIDQTAWYWKYVHVAGELCIFDFPLNAYGMGGFWMNGSIDRGDMAELLYRAKTVKDNQNHYYKKELIPVIVKNNQPKPTDASKCAENNYSAIINTNFESKKVYSFYDGLIKYYFDTRLFSDEETKNQYICKRAMLTHKSFKILEEYLGFTPTYEEIDIISVPAAPGNRGAFGGGNRINNYYEDIINKQYLTDLSFGDIHELVHVFFSETNVERSWFEEGLADFMQFFEQYGKNVMLSNATATSSSGYYCRNNGWENGYHSSDDSFHSNSGLIPYSDFSISPETTTEFYDPLNKSSYYRSAECLWGYIEENFGSEGIKKITKEWNKHRNSEVEKKWLIKDIINPILGTNLNNLIKERYNYIEQ